MECRFGLSLAASLSCDLREHDIDNKKVQKLTLISEETLGRRLLKYKSLGLILDMSNDDLGMAFIGKELIVFSRYSFRLGYDLDEIKEMLPNAEINLVDGFV